MDGFVTFDAVIAELNLLGSLLAWRVKHSTSIAPRSIRARDVVSYESVPSYEHPGRPNARIVMRSGECIFVKQHVNTVAERLGNQVRSNTENG